MPQHSALAAAEACRGEQTVEAALAQHAAVEPRRPAPAAASTRLLRGVALQVSAAAARLLGVAAAPIKQSLRVVLLVVLVMHPTPPPPPMTWWWEEQQCAAATAVTNKRCDLEN